MSAFFLKGHCWPNRDPEVALPVAYFFFPLSREQVCQAGSSEISSTVFAAGWRIGGFAPPPPWTDSTVHSRYRSEKAARVSAHGRFANGL